MSQEEYEKDKWESFEALGSCVDVLDEHDPNYSSEENEEFFETTFLGSYDPTMVPLFTNQDSTLDAAKAMRTMLSSFAINYDIADFVCSLNEIFPQGQRSIVAKSILCYCMDKSIICRHHLIALLAHLARYGEVQPFEITFAVAALTARLREILIDVYDAQTVLEGAILQLHEADVLDTSSARTMIKMGRALTHDGLPKHKHNVCELLREYFCGGDLHILLESYDGVEVPGAEFELARQSILLSMDMKNTEREYCSQLLASFVRSESQRLSLICAILLLLDNADDHALDQPQFHSFLASFLARAVADESIVPRFLQCVCCSFARGTTAHAIASSASSMLHAMHNKYRLASVWNQKRDLTDVKNEFDAIALELFDSQDTSHCQQLLQEMEVGYFHHEFVKRLFSAALDRSNREVKLVCSFLSIALRDEVISPNQIAKGIRKIKKRLPEYEIDAPLAPQYYKNLISILIAPTKA